MSVATYANRHLHLMRALDQHRVSTRMTEQWMKKFCGTTKLHELDAKQVSAFMSQLSGSNGEVHRRLCRQLHLEFDPLEIGD